MEGTCPYYMYEKKGILFCEGATIRYPDRDARSKSKSRYCCSEDYGFKKCFLYSIMNDYYERKFKGEVIEPLAPIQPDIKKSTRGRKSRIEGGM